MEFLKKHFFLDRTHSVHNVRCFRAPGRLLAKLFHGRSRKKRSSFKSALLSAIWDCGANKQLYDILAFMFDSLQVDMDDNREVMRELSMLVKRNPGLAGTSPIYRPEYAMVLNCDASLLRPLETVFWGLHTRSLGMNVGWFGK